MGQRAGSVYPFKNTKQVSLERKDKCFICKGLHSLRTVKQICFHDIMRSSNPSFRVPSRPRSTNVMIQRLNAEAISPFIKALRNKNSADIVLDLRMRSEAQNVLSVFS